jgi:SpoVK/Ycf46/Vps4 family AAA+-type ATPase
MAPAVLWIDEVEKALAASNGEHDGGVSQRVFGTFLSWLQERRGDVFVVATSNEVSRLPAEFIRKGRFDEVFFVDLPTRSSRSQIFRIHLRRRRVEVGAIDVDRLAEATLGFSGAEIEQVVISGLFTAFASRQPLSTDVLEEEIASTRPLARTMAERLTALRAWARDRTVHADTREWRRETPTSLKAVS